MQVSENTGRQNALGDSSFGKLRTSESPLQKQRNTLFNACFLQTAKQPLPQHTLTQDGAGGGKFRRELRARLCCALFNAIPNICALHESCRPKTRASLIAHIHESPFEQAHRRCKSAKFLRQPPQPTSSKDNLNLEFTICKLVKIPEDKALWAIRPSVNSGQVNRPYKNNASRYSMSLFFAGC